MSALHQHAKDVFLAALARPLDDRARFVAEACGTDARLRREVESLLEFHESDAGDGSLLDDFEPSRDLFAPGDVFATRYRMVTRIGRGGMGDVWRADDLVLDTPVALKVIHSTEPEGRERILNEVRLARQITHPAICRVFDVGEDSGHVFLSMELVNGEDLAALLRRVGRLPAEKVVDIGRQLCAGLAAAHAQGVLHRDLKPANVLIDDEGRVRITDFGIAITTDERARRSLTGTPGYMAPEQLMPGRPLSEQTDIYALGLVLYQLVVGRHPFTGTMESRGPQRPALLVPGVSQMLDRTIMQALSTEPDDRPASAYEMGEMLVAPPRAHSSSALRTWLGGVALVVVIVLLAVGASLLFSNRSAALNDQDTIVVADFANTTGEPVFDGTLKVALTVALEQTPFLRVFPDARVQETLRMMGRAPETTVTRAVAREVAQREQLKALLAGSIASLGTSYVIALEAINAQTGDVMAREQVQAPSKEEVLSAVGRVAASVRGRLGESLASIQKYDVSLARATTPSLEALHAYSLALDQGSVNPRREAIPHLQRAIALDPNFALAMALLATVYSNNGQTALAPEYAAKAFELRDRISERERFFVSFRYYRDATQDWEQALELARLWTATFPREAFAFNSLGTAFSRFGQYEASIEPFRQSIRLDSHLAAPYSNLAGVFLSLNRLSEAHQVLNAAAAVGATSSSMHRMAYLTAFLEQDRASMTAHFDASVGLDATNAAYGWEGHTLGAAGRIGAAHEQFRRGIDTATSRGFNEVAAQLSVEDAEVHAVAGQCRSALDEVKAALPLSRDNYTLERASRVLALCGHDSEARQISQELSTRFGEATLTMKVSLPLAAAAAALERRQHERVIELLEPVRLYDRAPKTEYWSSYLRGQAYLAMGDRQAEREFQSILDRQGEYPNSPLYPHARLGLARAAAATGDTARAAAAYDAFLAVWKDADPDLAVLKDATRERAALR